MSVHLKSIKGDKLQRRRYAVNPGRTKLLIKEYITWYNEQQEDNKKRIKNARHLALCLVDLYAKQFVRWQAIMGYDVEITNENLPHVSVNNEFLGSNSQFKYHSDNERVCLTLWDGKSSKQRIIELL